MELTKEQKESLEDLLKHDGWIIYQELLDDLLDIELKSLRRTDESNLGRCQGRCDLIEQDILYLVRDQLEEEKNDYQDSGY